MTCHPPLPDLWAQCLWALLLGSSLLFGILAGSSQAQITLDGSLGPPGPVHGPHARISADVGQIRGSNLFHSFGQFNVPTGGSATFAGPNTITNILSRVTGGQPSSIDGVLRSEIAGAHLYLLNPSGVMFGSNARLEVSGSFHVSTADFLRFTDGAKFSAHLGQASVLTVAEPAAFGFLGSNPAGVTIQSSALHILPGNTLSVVGGDLTLVGQGPLTVDRPPTLGTPRGRIHLVSVAAPGEVRFSPLELAPDLQMEGFARLGQITLAQGAYLDARGDGGGAVLIHGGRLVVDGSAILVDNLGDTDGAGLGIDVRVAAEAILRNGTLLQATTYGAGRGRDLQIRAGRVQLADSDINSRTFRSPGPVGNLTIIATDSIELRGSGVRHGASGFSGTSGRVALSAPILIMDHSGVGSNSGPGSRTGGIMVEVARLTLDRAGLTTDSIGTGSRQAGDLTITATDAIVLSGQSNVSSRAFGSGTGGRITISTPHLIMKDGAQIAAEIAGGPQDRGGDIQLQVGTLTLTGGARLSSSSGVELRDVSGELVGVSGGGQGGRITILATDLVSISGQNSGLFSEARRSFFLFPTGVRLEFPTEGSGGDIHLYAREIRFTEGATISATSDAMGRAGNIHISTTEGFRSDHSTVTGRATLADGGNITLTAGSRVQLMDNELTASVEGGPQTTGGNLTINAPFVILEGSQLRANAVAGQGGQIQINSIVFLADPASRVSASSELGIQGTVDIRAPVTTLSGTLAPLPQAFVSAAALLPARCAARAQDGRYSSLVLGGREGLPLDPGGLLPSPLTLDERLVGDPGVTADPHQPPSPTKFTFLTGADKAFPRLRGDPWAGRCPKAM